MYRASLGGGHAAHGVYRHALVKIITPLLAPLACGCGWSPLAVALAGVLMSIDPAPTLGQRFESVLGVLDAALPRRRRTGRTYQGFVKALSTNGADALALLGTHLRSATRAAAEGTRCWSYNGFVPIGADGSRIDAPRTIGNEPLGFAGRDECGPQMMTLLLVHLGVMLPWCFGVGGARVSERSLLRASLETLPENALLVADAGFTGFDLIGELLARGSHVLIRVGRGACLLKDLGYARREGKSTVYLWPDNRRRVPPLVLRLVRVKDVYLVTDVTDPRRLSRRLAGELYRRRWGLEVAFRSLKQTLEHRKVRSCTAAHAQMELSWSVVGLWVLALTGVRAVTAAGHGPRRLSIAGVLRAVRWAWWRPRKEAALRRRLRTAVQDGYTRKGSKKAWRWPHKKNPPPPGPPRVTTATQSQRACAKALRARLKAA